MMAYLKANPIIILCFIAFFVHCDVRPPEGKPLFTKNVPQNKIFKKELEYLKIKNRLTSEERTKIEKNLERVELHFGVPKALLWCVLFQESRFDVLKNATTQIRAKGLGQFTVSALDELNDDTNHYDPRTEKIMSTELEPETFPIEFHYEARPQHRKLSSSKRKLVEQKKASYFHTSTAVFASGAYLNNRYQQLRLALDRQKIAYDAQVLWLLAAAAYNKGSRTIFLLLTHEYLSRGESALSEILHDPKKTYAFLTHPERLDYSLKQVWAKSTRERYIIELLRNIEVISSCSLSEEVTS